MADTEKDTEEIKQEGTEAEETAQTPEETGAGETAQASEEAGAGETAQTPEEAEAGEHSDEADETEADEAEDEAEDDPDEPQKKERKLNWAKMGKDRPAKESREDALNARLEEEKDKYARLMAEFDNFRKRNEREKDAMYDFGARVVIEKILPVIDNFERGLAAIPEDEKEGAFAQGMDKTYRQFIEILEGLGVKPIEAVGREFDPEIHNAVMHVDDDEAAENIVVEEFQKGYTYKDKLVRPSMVKVAN